MKNCKSPLSLNAIRLGLAAAACAVAAPGLIAQSNYANAYSFTTLAGTAAPLSNTDGTGSSARFIAPTGMAVDSSGNMYVADATANTIRKITPSGVVTTLAGTADAIGSADGTGAAARFDSPQGIAVDSNGNLYVADTTNATIRKITPSGVVTTLAGTAGVTGVVDATGAAAQFSEPIGICVDGSGNVFVADQTGDTIRMITQAGVVKTIAGDIISQGTADGPGPQARFNTPTGICVDSGDNIYVADTQNEEIRKVAYSNGSATVSTIAGSPKTIGHADGTGAAASFDHPTGISIDGSGNIYISDTTNNTVRKLVVSSGAVTTLAGNPKFIGFADGSGTAAEFDGPVGIAADGSGNVYVADQVNSEIRKLTPGGTSSTVAGISGGGYADGAGAAAGFNFPSGTALDSSGNIYVADQDNDTIRKVTPSGVVTTLAGTPGNGGSADGTGSAAQFYFPYSVAVDGSGNVFVADSGNNTIRKVTPGGVVTTVAGQAGVNGTTNGTGAAATFDDPLGIAVDGSGNLFVADAKSNVIRMITPAGVVSTLAGTVGAPGSADGTGTSAKFDTPAGLTVDGSGNVFVSDATNAEIRKVTSGGVVTTFVGAAQQAGSADGTGANARFYYPVGISRDADGNLYVADSNNNEIRMITPAGVVTTLGGTAPPLRGPGSPPLPIPGHADGRGAAAEFYNPYGVAADAAGDVFVADSGNNTIRKGVFSGAPQISGQPTEQFVASGGNATFSVSASGGSALSYQWNFNGTPISGATGSSYTVSNAQSSDQGTYTVTVTDSDGSVTSSGAALNVGGSSGSARLTNISTRAVVGTGANILIPGFYISGSGTETLLIRGDGPSLGSIFNVAGSLAQPSLSVYSGSTVVASNTGWTTASNPALITSVSSQVGAFALPAGSADCAVIVTLNPGAYTVQISGVGGTTGVGLAEVYEVSYTGTAQLTNISTRAVVGTGANILIPGFYISGSGTLQLLVRGDGPSLGTTFNISGSLAQPSLSVYSGSTVIVSNTGWTTGTEASDIASVSASVGAFAFEAGSADSATIVNLPSGSYTVQLSGVGATTGVGLAEIYQIP